MADVRAVLFDFGNVIGFFDHQKALRRMAAHTDMTADELAAALVGGPLAEAYETGQIGTDEYVARALLDGRLTCTREVFLEHFTDIFAPNPEVMDLIPRLRPHTRLILASNTVDAHFRRYSADFAPTLAHFDALGASHLGRARKPDREFYAYVHGLAGCEAGECLFVDDLPVNVAAAEGYGFRGLVYRPDGTLEAACRAAGVLVN